MKFLGETLAQVSLLALLFVAGGSTAAWQPTLDCQTKCGNLTIEYPFGTSPGCYHDESFLITCNQTETEQKPFLRKGNIEVINISLNGELRILMNSSRACYNKTGTLIDYQDHYIQLTHFALSIKNMITAVGCDSYVYLNKMGVRDSSTGCLSVCNSTPPNDGLCSGDGCCQTPIPIGTSYFAVKPYSFNNHTDVFQFNPCSYAFLVEDGSFNFSASKDLVNLRNTTRFPVVVDWSIGDRKCDQIENNNSSCRENSICVNSTSGSGYTCECKKGFEGNPYLGCQDIDECSKDKHTCATQEICHNNIGSFHCKKRQELSIIVLVTELPYDPRTSFATKSNATEQQDSAETSRDHNPCAVKLIEMPSFSGRGNESWLNTHLSRNSTTAKPTINQDQNSSNPPRKQPEHTKNQHQLPIQQEQSQRNQIGELKSQNGKSTSKSKPEIKNGATGEQIHLGTPLIHQQSTEIVSTLSRNTNTRERGRREDESTREINAIKGNNNIYTTKKLPEGGPTTVLWKPPAAGQRRRW
ncbi:unnamed protein product [Arabidopsis arenosa]|uniref:EGF-like domain-containing protein n=1 Tax=Arabidopsis arenosa TaxID=38785 RepID=A0A8S2AMX1_ARAAE|nr:unnamed protein product [Arabidopsis arenosa]